MAVSVSNEKELWEAFRNQEQKIIVEGDLVPRLKKKMVFIKSAWIIALLYTALFGAIGAFCGMFSYKGAELVLCTVVFSLPGWVAFALAVLMERGKLGSGLPSQLAKYREGKEEWGSFTLTRK